MLLRRLTVLAGSTVALMALGSGSAFAHFCYFNDPNATANEKRAGSTAFVTFDEFVDFLGLCDAGEEILAGAGGVTMQTLINGRGVMAGPTGGNKAIGHLDFGALIGAGEDAFGTCGMELPDWWYE